MNQTPSGIDEKYSKFKKKARLLEKILESQKI
jgi:hypothetical protein